MKVKTVATLFFLLRQDFKKICAFVSATSLDWLSKLSCEAQTGRRPNQSILKEINLEYSLEGLMLKLKLQYFGHLMRRADSSQKTLILGRIEGKRRRGQKKMR